MSKPEQAFGNGKYAPSMNYQIHRICFHGVCQHISHVVPLVDAHVTEQQYLCLASGVRSPE